MAQLTRRWRHPFGRVIAAALLLAALACVGAGVPPQALANTPAAASGCQLDSAKGDIQHVIYIIFDNTHFLRDNPNVPSDLEQMPHLLNFIRGNGTLLTNDHTVLISHTANGILTSLTGVYSDRHGQAVSNSYRYFKADGTTASSSSFKYWTDLVDDTGTPPADPLPNMVNGDSGTPKNAPAPWVPYTRAGCDFGAVALANVVLENTGTGPAGDITKVFGNPSPEFSEAQTSNAAPAGTAARALAQTDFVGMAIHCGAGGGICAGNAHARPDLLPDEPGGYNGFQGLFGTKYVNPAITGGSAVLNNLFGQPITDPFGQNGFPGFDGLFASTTLACRRPASRSRSATSRTRTTSTASRVRSISRRAPASRRTLISSSRTTTHLRSSSTASPPTGSRKRTHSLSSRSRRATTSSARSQPPRTVTASTRHAPTASWARSTAT